MWCYLGRPVEGFVRDGRVRPTSILKVMMVSLDLVVVVFQKTYNVIYKLCENRGVDMNVLKELGRLTLEVRPERDWEKLKGMDG